MILSLLILLNSFIFFKFFDTSDTFFTKFIIFNDIIFVSYFEIDMLIKFIEKFTTIRFLNGLDQFMATSYYKEKYFGKTDKTIYEICNV